MIRYSTANHLTAIRTLLSKNGMKGEDTKKEIVAAYTGGRTDSIRAMYFQEAEQLISYLKSLDPEVAKAEKMRKKIISMAHEMGWKLPSGKIDMKHVNDWCIKYGHAHKTLNDYRYNELPALVTQFQAAYKEYLKKV